MSRAVVLLRVSDRNVKARQRFRETAARLQARLDGTPVLAAYVVPGAVPNELTLSRAVAQLVAGGATEIAVVPYEVEWKTGEWQDVPDTIQELARANPQVRLHLAQPLGTAEGLVEVVARRCEAAWSLPVVGARGIEVARGESPPAVATVTGPPPARQAPRLPARGRHVLACFGRVCQQYGSGAIYAALTALLAERGLDPESTGRRPTAQGDAADEAAGDRAMGIKVTPTKCLGPCAGAALACVYPGGAFYWNLRPELMPRFVDEVLVGGGALPGHTFRPGDPPPSEAAQATP